MEQSKQNQDLINLSFDADPNNGLIHVSIQPRNDKERIPCDICCVVDVSGSMSVNVSLKNNDGSAEVYNLSILDIVKHSIKTIIQTLQPQDRLSIVKYSEQAEVVIELTNMNDEGKQLALSKLETLYPDASTNLWDGLHKGLEVLRNNKREGVNSAVFILTDGQPNINPPRGHIPMLEQYKQKHGQFPGIINTFGFGYSLESKLLDEIAVLGDGSYCFIPDASFVGTIFINSLANFLTGCATNCSLTFNSLNNQIQFSQNKFVEGYTVEKTENGSITINIGQLNFGQSRDIIIQVKNFQPLGPYLKATLSYNQSGKVNQISCEGNSYNNDKQIQIQYARLRAATCIRQALVEANQGQFEQANKIVANMVKQVSENQLINDDKFIQDLLLDLKGQVKEALENSSSFIQWGVHYLPSLSRAHMLQQCNNFKDPGVQHYGKDLFQEIRDLADEIFLKIPPPKPQVMHYGDYGAYGIQNQGAGHQPLQVNMAAFNNRNGACFEGSGLVLLSDNSLKKVNEIRKNDEIMTPNGQPSKVVCVLKTNIIEAHRDQDLVKLDQGLILTPYHPVKVQGVWQFPIDIGQAIQKQDCEAVYSFVLEKGHIMIINQVECVTLGHGFTDNEVISHPYFGTQKVIEELKQMKGWSEGFVQINSDCAIKDPETGLIYSMQQRI